MKVSIITIVYNNEEHIADCIQSVCNQCYKNIEYIIIDGNSIDGTKKIIKQFEDKISVFKSASDNGLYDALNKGIKLATGDIVGILHSDDLFYNEGVIERVVNAFKNKTADIVYGNGIYVDRNNISKVRRVYSSSPFKSSYLKYGWIPLHTTIFVKRKVYKELGLYNLQYSIASDYDISLRWFLVPDLKKIYLNKYFVKMRLGGKSTKLSLQYKKSYQDLQIIKSHNLRGWFTLTLKLLRKIPQYIKPIFLFK